jgi:CBS domain containing-hemolysin-like protein
MAPSSGAEDDQGSYLAANEVSIIHNVLDLSRKRAGNLCTPLSSVFALCLDDVLDEAKILEVGSYLSSVIFRFIVMVIVVCQYIRRIRLAL